MGQVQLGIFLKLFDQASAGFAKFHTNATNALQGVEKSLKAADAAAAKFERTNQALNTAGIALGVAGAGLGMVATSGLDASMQMEGYMAKLTVALKDGAKAAEMMAWAKR